MRTICQFIVTALTYDFCPWANRWLQWMKRPLAVVSLATVAAGGCVLVGKPAAWIVLVAVSAVLGIGFLWPTLSIRGLSATVRFPQRRVTEQERALGIVRVVNRCPWPVWGIVLDAGIGPENAVALARIPARSASEFHWEFVPTLRGEYPESAPRLSTGFPFGLRHASRAAAVDRSLLVWPRIIPLGRLVDAPATRPADQSFSDRRAGDDGDISGTRAYRPGDSLRRVHWAQTARTGCMIACERQAAARSAIRVVCDAVPFLQCGSGPDSTLEWAVRIVASVCAAYHRENAHVECSLEGEAIQIASGLSGLECFLDSLARWKPGGHKPPARIHRRSRPEWGVWQLTVTADRALAPRDHRRLLRGNERQILLRSPASMSECLCQPPSSEKSAAMLGRPEDVATDFLRQWRQMCHGN